VSDVPPLDWPALVDAATISAAGHRPVRAVTYIRKWDHADSEPALLTCDDGQAYVVKSLRVHGISNGRVIVNEQIVGRLGARLGAPVGEVRFVDVPDELIAAEPDLAHLSTGIAHGSLWIPHCTDREGLRYTTVPANRARFALLAILYTWVGAKDQQFIYRTNVPHLVYSVDHGHFFPRGPYWTITSLHVDPLAELDPTFAACRFSRAERSRARGALDKITHQTIAEAVAAPPDAWGISMQERIAMAEYVARRRAELISLLP